MTQQKQTSPTGEYHKYIRDDRKAIVYRNGHGFYVELYDKDVLVETRELYEHSEKYAEDCAENYVDGVFNVHHY